MIPLGAEVKYSHPLNEVEAGLRFTLVEDNGDRVKIRFKCDLAIAPVECVEIGEIAPVLYRCDSLADLQGLPEGLQGVVLAIWKECKNTYCLLTDHDFTESEARETLAQLNGGGR